jgi:hypothetical protein
MEPNVTRDVDDAAGHDPLFEANRITLRRGFEGNHGVEDQRVDDDVTMPIIEDVSPSASMP